MKNSLNHLPKDKQDELQKITSIICNNCQELEKIILFGSYARGDYKEEKDLIKDKEKREKLNQVPTAHISDYDILVVTTTKTEALNHILWGDIKEKKLKPLKFSADPRIITHDINELNNKLEEGQYFFSDIVKEGIILFDNKKNKLSEEKDHKNEEARKIAQKNFDEWFKSATEFFIDYENAFDRGSYKKESVFLTVSI